MSAEKGRIGYETVNNVIPKQDCDSEFTGRDPRVRQETHFLLQPRIGLCRGRDKERGEVTLEFRGAFDFFLNGFKPAPLKFLHWIPTRLPMSSDP
jgi:hypothetical protein